MHTCSRAPVWRSSCRVASRRVAPRWTRTRIRPSPSLLPTRRLSAVVLVTLLVIEIDSQSGGVPSSSRKRTTKLPSTALLARLDCLCSSQPAARSKRGSPLHFKKLCHKSTSATVDKTLNFCLKRGECPEDNPSEVELREIPRLLPLRSTLSICPVTCT